MCFLLHYDITVCFLKVGICRQGSHILETFQTWREIGAKNQLEIREGSRILERIETKATTFIISTCHQVATDPNFVIRLRWSRTRVASTSLTDQHEISSYQNWKAMTKSRLDEISFFPTK